MAWRNVSSVLALSNSSDVPPSGCEPTLRRGKPSSLLFEIHPLPVAQTFLISTYDHVPPQRRVLSRLLCYRMHTWRSRKKLVSRRSRNHKGKGIPGEALSRLQNDQRIEEGSTPLHLSSETSCTERDPGRESEG